MKYFDILKILRKSTKVSRNVELKYEILDKYLIIWTTSRYGKSERIKINRFWGIDKPIINLVGLIDSDGYNIQSKAKGFRFVNSDINLVKFVIDCLLMLGIEKSKIKAHIRLLRCADYKAILNKWSNHLGLNKNQFWKPQLEEGNHKDRCAIIYYNKAFRTLFDKFRLIVRNFITTSKILSPFYLQGIFAGESTFGNNEIQIAFNPRTDPLNVWLDALNRIGIKRFKIKNDRRMIKISGLDNFSKIYNNDLFNLDKDKYIEFCDRISSIRITFVLNVSFRNKLFRNTSISQKALAKDFLVSPRMIYTYVNGKAGIPFNIFLSMIPYFGLNQRTFINGIDHIRCGVHRYQPIRDIISCLFKLRMV